MSKVFGGRLVAFAVGSGEEPRPSEVVDMDEQRGQVLTDEDIKTEWRRTGASRSPKLLADPDAKDADTDTTDADTTDTTDSDTTDTTDTTDSDTTDSDSDSTDS
jgi:hypothetical protein